MKRKITMVALAMACLMPLTSAYSQQGAPQPSGSNSLESLFANKPAKFLPVMQAFSLNPTVADDTLTLRIQIAPGYYLYQDKLHLTLADGTVLDNFEFSIAPTTVDDPQFGAVAVFTRDVVASLPLNGATGEALLGFQGCAEAGLCYPPEKIPVQLDGEISAAQVPAVSTTSAETTPTTATLTGYQLNHTLAGESDPFGVANRPMLAVLLLFLAGLLLAFTPCVYPMIPIIAGIVATGKPTARRGFVLTASYGLGVSVSYGALGALVAWFGRGVGVLAWLQNPYILLGFAALFVLLGLQMLDVVQLKMPQALSSRLQQGAGRADRFFGTAPGSFVAGILSALVVSPCVSVPMAGALGAVGVSGNIALGFVALFALGIGLSLPLVVIGTTQGKFMPKSGAWMIHVKQFGGLLLFAVALLLVNRVVATSWMLLLWALWFAVLAGFFWRLKHTLARLIALPLGVWAGCLLVGAGLGAVNVWQPFAPLRQPTDKLQSAPIVVTTLAELDKILASNSNVVVDITAEWCIECKIMDANLFQNPPPELGNWQVVKLDITETSADSRAVLARYNLFGPPALLYYQEGQWVAQQLGEISRTDFVAQLQQLARR